jgi:ABC-type glycerol-3-phosphate transport system permease component
MRGTVNSRHPARLIARTLHAAAVALAVSAVVIPLAYLVLNSLKLPREFLTVPPTLFPSEITLEHYAAS